MRNNSIGQQIAGRAFNMTLDAAVATRDRLGGGNIVITILLFAFAVMPFIPAPAFALSLPLAVALVWLLTARLVVRTKFKMRAPLKILVEHSRGLPVLAGISFLTAALAAATPYLGALGAGVGVVRMVLSAVLVFAAIVLGVTTGRSTATHERRTLAEEESLLIGIALGLGITPDVLVEAFENRDMTMAATPSGGVAVLLPEKHWNTLVDAAKAEAGIETFLPEFEVTDITPFTGALTLEPVSAQTEAARMNLKRSGGVTKDDVTFDFGEDGDKVERMHFGGDDGRVESIDFGG